MAAASPKYIVGEASKLGLDVSTIAGYIRSEWKRPLAMEHETFYTWQFMNVPGNDRADRCVVVATEDGDVSGFMGLNPRPFHVGGQEVQGAELTTWMISEHARGKGYGQGMLDYLKATYEVLLGMGITKMAVPVYTRLGFRYIKSIPRYVRIYNVDKVIEVSQAEPLGRKLARAYRRIRVDARYDVERVDLSRGCDEADHLHEHFHCFDRSPAYLAWRYEQHPVYSYDAVRIKKGKHSAILVVRIDVSEALRVMHVTDLFGEEEAFDAAIAYADAYGQEQNADMADFYCITDRVAHRFWSQGWFSMLDDYFLQVPHLFYPLEVRSPPTTSLILWSRHHLTSMMDRSALYVTKEDCDLDRPTQAYLDTHGWK